MASAFDKIKAGLEDAIAYAEGDTTKAKVYKVQVHNVDVAKLRHRLKMSQAEFSHRFGFSKRNVQNWEQGEREPTGAVRAFLQVIEKEPEAAMRALQVEVVPMPARRKRRAKTREARAGS